MQCLILNYTKTDFFLHLQNHTSHLSGSFQADCLGTSWPMRLFLMALQPNCIVPGLSVCHALKVFLLIKSGILLAVLVAVLQLPSESSDLRVS